MKLSPVLALILGLSISINIVQFIDKYYLEQTVATMQSTIDSYETLLDQAEEEAHELRGIGDELRRRNNHVPGVVIDQWAATILKASQIHDLDSKLLMNLYRVESAFVHYSREGFITVSYAGAGGLGQIMPFWYKACPYSAQPRDLDNAGVNIMCSAFILRHYLNENNQDIFLALTAYNAGPRGVKYIMRGKDITDGYAQKILTGWSRDRWRTKSI